MDSLRARRVVLNDEGCDNDHELLGFWLLALTQVNGEVTSLSPRFGLTGKTEGRDNVGTIT
jgi:hypothetical protein